MLTKWKNKYYHGSKNKNFIKESLLVNKNRLHTASKKKRGNRSEKEQGWIYRQTWLEEKEGRNFVIILYSQNWRKQGKEKSLREEICSGLVGRKATQVCWDGWVKSWSIILASKLRSKQKSKSWLLQISLLSDSK